MARKLRFQYEQKAERIIKGRMYLPGWTSQDLPRLSKGQNSKIRIARLLRSETTVIRKWSAQRLQMGTWTHLGDRLYHAQV